MEFSERSKQGHHGGRTGVQRGVAGTTSKLDDESKSVAQRRADPKLGKERGVPGRWGGIQGGPAAKQC